MPKYGLIGYPLSHSFSKRYFTEKFEREQIENSSYHLYEIADLEDFPILIQNQTDLVGLNVTIPHKEAIMPYLDKLAPSATKVGAVNVIKREANGALVGHNSDFFGFLNTLSPLLQPDVRYQALVLGNGGAAKAVQAALRDLEIAFTTLSRRPRTEIEYLYEDCSPEMIAQHLLIINTTPLGMYPNIHEYPDIPYAALTTQHILYDLVYNPEETIFLAKGKAQGATIQNGLPMLYAQAEKAWEIWQEQMMQN